MNIDKFTPEYNISVIVQIFHESISLYTTRRQYVSAAPVSWRSSDESGFITTEPSPALFHMDVGEGTFYDHGIEVGVDICIDQKPEKACSSFPLSVMLPFNKRKQVTESGFIVNG